MQSIKNHAGIEWVDMVSKDVRRNLFYRAKKVSAQEQAVVRNNLEKNGVEIIFGYGCLKDKNQSW